VTASRLSSDRARNYVAGAVGLPPAAALAFAQRARWGAEAFWDSYLTTVVPTIMLVFWTVTCLVYAALTHRTVGRLGASELRRFSRRQAAARREPRWKRLLGMGTGPGSWAANAIVIVIAFTLLLAQGEAWRTSPWLVGLSAASVAASWLVMVVSHALRYAESDSGDAPALRFTFPEPPVYSDYLRHSLLVSVAGALAPATPVTREGWSDLARHSLVAFIVNGVLVAMVVTLMLGRLA